MANLVIGLIFFTLIGFAARKSYISMKSNKCPGCSGGCAEQSKSCQIKL